MALAFGAPDSEVQSRLRLLRARAPLDYGNLTQASHSLRAIAIKPEILEFQIEPSLCYRERASH